MGILETIKSFFWKGLNILKQLLDIFNRQTKSVKIASSIAFGVGFLMINKLYKNYNYNKKEFELTRNNTSSKVILVTGCGSGIGEATALKLNNLGFVVIATCRRKESVDKWLSNKSFIKNSSTSYQLDISSHDNILNIKKTLKSFLKENNYILWGIVNNAGIINVGLFEFLSHDDVKKHIDINIYGTINMCHEFVPLLYGRCNKINGYKSSNGGRIVNVSSLTAKFPLNTVCVYGATKAAISHFSHGLRIELSPRFGIWCTTIELGPFKTNMVHRNDDNVYDELVKNAENRDNISSFYNIKTERIFRDTMKENTVFQENLDIVVDDIIHSLIAKNPKRTYKPGTQIPHIISYLVKNYQTVERKLHASGLENYHAK